MDLGGLYTKVLLATPCLYVSASFLLYSAWNSSLWICLLLGTIGSFLMGVSLLYCWALTHRLPYYQRFLHFNCILLLALIMKLMGHFSFKKAIDSWKYPRKYQEELLRSILKENGETEYGKRFNLRDIRSLEEFRKSHPLTTYEHFRSYVERMMDGEEGVLTAKKPTVYARTTGTTGKSKHIPYVNKMALMQQYGAVQEVTISETAPALDPFQRRLYLYVQPQVDKTKSGANVETIGTLPELPAAFLSNFTTPAPGFRIKSSYESNYIHLLFGLRERDLGLIYLTFLVFLENAIEQLKDCWRDILYDLEHGTINTNLKLPSNIREALLPCLGKGDPARARELRGEFEKGFSGILKRIWPRLRIVVGVDRTGRWPKIEQKYGRGVVLLGGGYGCTEGFFATYLGPTRMKEVTYLTLPMMVVAEFIKEADIGESQPKTYFLDELEEGECYEVVLTQRQSCLYRYRLGDVIKVTGFYENTPCIKFMYRTGQILNLIYEKLDQAVVEDAVRAAVGRWKGASLVDFVVAESTLVPEDYTGLPGHERTPYYIFFVQIEADSSRSSTNLSPQEKDMIEEELRQRNGDFDRLRREDNVSRSRIYAVRPDGFDVLQKHIVANSNASILQYKTPRKLRLFPMVEVMLKNSYQD